MDAICALKKINREGIDNSRWDVIEGWNSILTDEDLGHSLSSLIREIFGESAEIMHRDFAKCWEVKSVMYVYREEGEEDERLMDDIELPIMTIYVHEWRQWIDLYELK